MCPKSILGFSLLVFVAFLTSSSQAALLDIRADVGCGGDPNAEFRECTRDCTPTCDDPNPDCIEVCDPPGCECKRGYVMLNGKCVDQNKCQEVGCGGDPNAEFHECTSPCTPTCDNPRPKCIQMCDPPGCECKRGHVMLNGRCEPYNKCPAVGCGGDPNAVFSDCTSTCIPTCDNPRPQCNKMCDPPGCECKRGHVMLNGKCEPYNKCPAVGCGGDPNAEFHDCTSPCTPTCDNPNPRCIERCDPPGCECKRGHVMLNGKCEPQSKCPAAGCGGDPNAEFRGCTSPCTPTCEDPNPICIQVCYPPGCQCKRGYVMLNGKCEPRSKC